MEKTFRRQSADLRRFIDATLLDDPPLLRAAR